MVTMYTQLYLSEICIATGKSCAASGGKYMSQFFLPNGVAPSGRVPGATSMTCSFAPAPVFAEKVKSVEGEVAPSTVNWANEAAWPSIGCETFFSFE